MRVVQVRVYSSLQIYRLLFNAMLLRLLSVFLQVWFQNRRAKEKRMKKDAGRQRWTPSYGNYYHGKGQSEKETRPSDDDLSEDGKDIFQGA